MRPNLPEQCEEFVSIDRAINMTSNHAITLVPEGQTTIKSGWVMVRHKAYKNKSKPTKMQCILSNELLIFIDNDTGINLPLLKKKQRKDEFKLEHIFNVNARKDEKMGPCVIIFATDESYLIKDIADEKSIENESSPMNSSRKTQNCYNLLSEKTREWLNVLKVAVVSRRMELRYDNANIPLLQPPMDMYDVCWDVTILAHKLSNNATRSLNDSNSRDPVMFRDLSIEHPALQKARRFCLPKNREYLVFFIKGKNYGDPMEQWDILTVPRCHVSHYCVLDNLIMFSFSRSSATGIGCLWMDVESDSMKLNIFNEIRHMIRESTERACVRAAQDTDRTPWSVREQQRDRTNSNTHLREARIRAQSQSSNRPATTSVVHKSSMLAYGSCGLPGVRPTTSSPIVNVTDVIRKRSAAAATVVATSLPHYATTPNINIPRILPRSNTMENSNHIMQRPTLIAIATTQSSTTSSQHSIDLTHGSTLSPLDLPESSYPGSHFSSHPDTIIEEDYSVLRSGAFDSGSGECPVGGVPFITATMSAMSENAGTTDYQETVFTGVQATAPADLPACTSRSDSSQGIQGVMSYILEDDEHLQNFGSARAIGTPRTLLPATMPSLQTQVSYTSTSTSQTPACTTGIRDSRSLSWGSTKGGWNLINRRRQSATNKSRNKDQWILSPDDSQNRGDSFSSGRSTPYRNSQLQRPPKPVHLDDDDLVEMEFPTANSETTASPSGQHRSRSDSMASDQSAFPCRSRTGSFNVAGLESAAIKATRTRVASVSINQQSTCSKSQSSDQISSPSIHSPRGMRDDNRLEQQNIDNLLAQTMDEYIPIGPGGYQTEQQAIDNSLINWPHIPSIVTYHHFTDNVEKLPTLLETNQGSPAQPSAREERSSDDSSPVTVTVPSSSENYDTQLDYVEICPNNAATPVRDSSNSTTPTIQQRHNDLANLQNRQSLEHGDYAQIDVQRTSTASVQ